MKRFSSTLIGLFVLGALFLAVVGIISFGANVWWRDREHLALYFPESVHGLERGSAVKLMGVPVGRVASINVAYVGETGTLVQVICEIDRTPFTVDPAGTRVEMRDRETLRRMVEDGLQARLDLIGITGMLYVEMDFWKTPARPGFAVEHPSYVVVPTVPSAFAGLIDNLSEVARDLGEIDFAGIGQAAETLLGNANAAFEQARVEELFGRLHETVGNVNDLLDSPELHRAIVTAGDSFESLARLANHLESEVDLLSDELVLTSRDLRAALREIGQTFESIQDIIGPQLGLGAQLNDTMQTIDEAARSVGRLADYLERNPQAIVRGRGGEQR